MNAIDLAWLATRQKAQLTTKDRAGLLRCGVCAATRSTPTLMSWPWSTCCWRPK